MHKLLDLAARHFLFKNPSVVLTPLFYFVVLVLVLVLLLLLLVVVVVVVVVVVLLAVVQDFFLISVLQSQIITSSLDVQSVQVGYTQ